MGVKKLKNQYFRVNLCRRTQQNKNLKANNPTQQQRRSNPNEYSFNTGCVEGFKAEDYSGPYLIDGINHIKDRKEL